jgi:GDP-L-fucose synthase
MRAGATILVTGGRGFLGQHVTAELIGAGYNATAVGSADFDLRRRLEIDRMLAAHRPDAVIHLAAVVGGIAANRAAPGQFFYENAIMGIELLEACRLAGIAKTVVAGTVCAYPKYAEVPFREGTIWSGYPEETNAPYGLAKKMLLVQAQAYRQQYDLNIVYLLPVNLYGPGDNFDLDTSHVIPGMIRRISTAADSGRASVTLWGDGSPTREFLYVKDAARAFRLALENYDDGDPINIGSGEEIRMDVLATLIARLTGYNGQIRWDTSKPNGQPRRCLDTSAALQHLGFRAEVSLADGIAHTIAWARTAMVAGPI